MKILILNWKDPRNPSAGGAETFTHEIARRLVASGDKVTVFSQLFPGGRHEDILDGVRIIRRGGKYSVYRAARSWYREGDRPKYDVVVDEINTRPFLAPAFVRDARVVALIHQLAREVWSEEMPFPLSFVGRHFLEPRWLGCYRAVPTITVSPSTRNDLSQLGFTNVSVVPEGLSPLPELGEVGKEEIPTLVFVGRLVKTKRPHHAIAAWRAVRATIPQTRLWVVGDGYLRRTLDRQPEEGLHVLGSVDERTKYELMKRASLMLVPGVREGWGLVVIEANAVGTPAVAYRIPGLVDSVQHGYSGLLTDPHPESLAGAAIRLLRNPRELERLSINARAWASRFDWDITARAFRELLV